MAGKKVNQIVIIIFIVVSVILIIIDFAIQFTGDKEFYRRKSEISSKPAESTDSTRSIEEEIQLPVDFKE